MGGWGVLSIPKSFVILKIAQKPLNHLNITQKFPTWPRKIPKAGGGGGGPPFGEKSQLILNLN